MSKKSRRSNGTLAAALRDSFVLCPAVDLLQPLIHINCHGSVEVENCSRVLEYGEHRIRLQVRNSVVTLEGEGLLILSLNAHVTEIRGRIFRLSLAEETS